MIRFIIIALIPLAGWGQGKLPGIISAEKLLATNPQKAAAIAKNIFTISQAKPDYYNTAYSSLLLSTVQRQAGYYLQALYYDSVAVMNARYSNDTVLLRKAVNSYAASTIGAGKIQQAKFILDHYKLLFIGKGNVDECRWHTLYGTCQLKQMQYDTAIASYRRGIFIADSIQDISSAMFLKMMLGKAYITRLNFDSLHIEYEALSYFEATNNYINAAHAATNLGLAFKLSYNPDMALSYFTKAFDYSELANSSADREDIRMHIGEMYQAQKKYELAREALITSHFAYKKMNMPYCISTSATLLGTLYAETEHYDSAVYYLNYAETMAKPFNNNLLMASVIGGKIKLAFKQMDFKAIDTLGAMAMYLVSKNMDKELVNALSKRLAEGTTFLPGDVNALKTISFAHRQPVLLKDHSTMTISEVQRLGQMNRFSGTNTEEDSTLLARTNRDLMKLDKQYKTKQYQDSIAIKNKQSVIDKQKIKLANSKFWFVAGLLLVVSAGLGLQYKSRKRAERDKAKIELLQNEIHHRVKNNLAVLNRVVDVAGKDNGENIPAVALKNRIKSIELLHQQLYSGQAKIGNISLQTYFTDLCAAIAATFETTKAITIAVNAPLEIESHIAEKLGLMVNELVTNSYKYAFTGKTCGTISVIAKLEKQQLYLVVKDNGIGVQAGKNAKSYGMKLIKGLSSELDAKFAFENADGTVFKLAIPLTVS